MIPTLIKTITLTYPLIDIRITVMCVNVTSKRILSTTLRTVVSSTTTTIPLQLISIFTIHTDIYYIVIIVFIFSFFQNIGILNE